MANWHDDERWLREQHESGLSQRDIARLAGVSAPTIRARFRQFNIQPRSISEGLLYKSEHISASSSSYWADAMNRARHSKRLAAVQAGRAVELSAAAKRNWANNRNAIVAGIKKAATAERNDKISKSVKKWWTAARRKAQSLRSAALWQDPAYAAKRALALGLVTSTPEFAQKVAEASRLRWQSSNYRTAQARARASGSSESVLEKIVARCLAERGIAASAQAHGPWTFDLGFTIGERRILIECQGTYWHSSEAAIRRDQQKRTYFDRYLAATHELHYIYEHQFYGLNKINQLIDQIIGRAEPQIEFTFNEVKLQRADGALAKPFFDSYHYLGSGRSGCHIGAFIDDKLIACLTYTSVTRLQTALSLNQAPTALAELSRMCIHPAYHRRNFASWLLARSLNFLPDKIAMVVAFTDIGAGHTGAIYKAAGWKLTGTSAPSYWYVDADGTRYHKKSIWDQARRMRMTESAYAEMVGIVRCRGLPTLRFTKEIQQRRHHKSV